MWWRHSPWGRNWLRIQDECCLWGNCKVLATCEELKFMNNDIMDTKIKWICCAVLVVYLQVRCCALWKESMNRANEHITIWMKKSWKLCAIQYFWWCMENCGRKLRYGRVMSTNWNINKAADECTSGYFSHGRAEMHLVLFCSTNLQFDDDWLAGFLSRSERFLQGSLTSRHLLKRSARLVQHLRRGFQLRPQTEAEWGRCWFKGIVRWNHT